MFKKTIQNVTLDCYTQRDAESRQPKCLKGVISKISSKHLRFEESLEPRPVWVRNPRLYEGEYIFLVRCKDGSLKFNFKKVNVNATGFNANEFAFRVYAEIGQALNSYAK